MIDDPDRLRLQVDDTDRIHIAVGTTAIAGIGDEGYLAVRRDRDVVGKVVGWQVVLLIVSDLAVVDGQDTRPCRRWI